MVNICCRIFVMLTIGSIPIHLFIEKRKEMLRYFSMIERRYNINSFLILTKQQRSNIRTKAVTRLLYFIKFSLL